MKKHIFFAFVILSASAQCIYAQTKWIRTNPSAIVLDTMSAGVDVVYKFSDSVYYRGKGHAVSFPENFVAQDTGYFFMYFPDNENAVIKKEVTCLIKNYKSDSATLFLDNNGDLIFAQDEAKFYANLSAPFQISIPHPKTGKAVNFLLNMLQNKDSLNTNFYQKHWGKVGKRQSGAIVEEVKYWFNEQSLNVKYVDLKGQCRIGLMDSQDNGTYNDHGSDRILVACGNNLKLHRSEWKGARILSDSTTIALNNEFYQVIKVAATGDSLQIEKASPPKTTITSVNQLFPNVVFYTFNNEPKKVIEFLDGKSYLIIDVWGSWCGGCTAQLPELKQCLSSNKDLKIFGLNYGDTEESFSNYTQMHEINWVNARLTKSQRNELNIEGFPTYILLDPNGIVLEVTNIFGIVENTLIKHKAFQKN